MNDDEEYPTAIWLMRTMGTTSRGVSFVNGAKVGVDTDHAATFYGNNGRPGRSVAATSAVIPL